MRTYQDKKKKYLKNLISFLFNLVIPESLSNLYNSVFTLQSKNLKLLQRGLSSLIGLFLKADQALLATPPQN